MSVSLFSDVIQHFNHSQIMLDFKRLMRKTFNNYVRDNASRLKASRVHICKR